MTELFHLGPAPLAVGSVIAPGNWGRIIKKAGWAHKLALRETALEHARQAKFPRLPSRLECVFGFLTKEEAEQFRNQMSDGFQFHILYRVSLEKPDSSLFVTNWNLVNPQGAFVVEWADCYWRAEGISTSVPVVQGAVGMGVLPCREVLTVSHLKIEERLD